MAWPQENRTFIEQRCLQQCSNMAVTSHTPWSRPQRHEEYKVDTRSEKTLNLQLGQLVLNTSPFFYPLISSMCREQIGKEVQQWEWRQMNGVKMLASILSFQFTDVMKADDFQDTCISAQAARGEPSPVGVWGRSVSFTQFRLSLLLINPSLLVIAETTASCQREPLWPAFLSALCPCHGRDCSGFFSVVLTQKSYFFGQSWAQAPSGEEMSGVIFCHR